MNYSMIILVLLSVFIGGRTEKINALKTEAKKAYQSGEYAKSIETYQFLVDSLAVHEEEVLLNLANSYFHVDRTEQAEALYSSLTHGYSSKIKSLAHQQLGVLDNRAGKFKEALDHFKASLKANLANEDARYNYEMIKKKLKDQNQDAGDQKGKENEQQKDQEKKDQQGQEKKDQQGQEKKDQQGQEKKDQQGQEKKDQQGQEKKDQQGQEKKDQQGQEKKDQQGQEKQKDEEGEEKNKDAAASVSEKLKAMEMSEEKARMILEAMRNQEIQYLQQKKRKSSKSRDSGKPDW